MKPSKSSDLDFPHGVTGTNYAKKAEAFCAAREQEPFVIARAKIRTQHGELAATPRQWGAWMAYFRKIGGPWKSAEGTRNFAGLGYCGVPAEWPHLFDSEAKIADDYVAADRYETALASKPREVEMTGDRRDAVARILKRFAK